MTEFRIQLYENKDAVFAAYDPRSAQIAQLLKQAIQQRDARLEVDHIGSTAVPGCRGKGIVDLAVTYPEGDLENAKSALDALGFQRQTGRDPFPETRPMRVASVAALGGVFQIHAHVIPRHGAEHRELVGFRDSLRADPELRRAYEQHKERIVTGGVTDSLDYCYAKGSFITDTLAKIAKP